MNLIVDHETIAAAGQHLAATSRGRQAMTDLLHLLENGGMSLDSENQQAFLILLTAAFGDYTGTALEILREAADKQEALESLTGAIRESQAQTAGIDHEAVARFCDLAATGALPGASTGERTCHRLATALYHIGDDVALLDPRARGGATGLIFAMAGPWPTADEKTRIYALLRRAAGKDKPAKKKARP